MDREDRIAFLVLEIEKLIDDSELSSADALAVIESVKMFIFAEFVEQLRKDHKLN